MHKTGEYIVATWCKTIVYKTYVHLGRVKIMNFVLSINNYRICSLLLFASVIVRSHGRLKKYLMELIFRLRNGVIWRMNPTLVVEPTNWFRVQYKGLQRFMKVCHREPITNAVTRRPRDMNEVTFYQGFALAAPELAFDELFITFGSEQNAVENVQITYIERLASNQTEFQLNSKMFKQVTTSLLLMPSVKSLSIFYGNILFTIDRHCNCKIIPRTSKHPSVNVRCSPTINFLNYLLTGRTEIVYKTRKMIHIYEVKKINTANGGKPCTLRGITNHWTKMFSNGSKRFLSLSF